MLGKSIRLKKLFKHSDKLLIVAMDHGMTLGPIEGIEHIGQAAQSVFAGKADAIVIHKGLMSQIAPIMNSTSGELIVHLSASTQLASNSDEKRLVSNVEHAVQLGATAISVHVNLGSQTEADMLEHLGMVAEECDRWGMPLLAMIYVRNGKKEDEFKPKNIGHAVRVAEELGADIVKVNYTGSIETFKEVTKSANIPVVIAGGPKVETTEALLRMIADAADAGASGVSMGRNVFQHANPEKVALSIRQILDSTNRQAKVEELLKAMDLSQINGQAD